VLKPCKIDKNSITKIPWRKKFMNLLIAFIAFDIIVIVHELGHFIAARLTGIKVLEFSLFVGPKIFSIKRGETTYSLRLIPALAYVRMEGEEEESDDERAFSKRPVWARFITVFSGPAASILLGVIFLAVSYLIAGVDTTKLSDVPKDSPAYKAGLRAGDKIISYNQSSVYQPLDVSMFMYASKGKPVNITFKRGDTRLKTAVTPDIIHENRYLLGFTAKTQYGSESNVVNTVEKGSAAEKGGLKPGDQIIKINDKQVSYLYQISSYLYESKGAPDHLQAILSIIHLFL
jgi:regulator of sigma E protease